LNPNAGSCFGLVLGIMLGTMIGAPMALVTWGSILDAVKNNEKRTFSLDNGATDIPGNVLAERIQEDWGQVYRYIFIDQLALSIGIGAAVGLGFGFLATMAASTAKMAMSARSLIPEPQTPNHKPKPKNLTLNPEAQF